MINISEATAIALHVMIYTANKDDSVHTLKEISSRFKVSENHLSKVLQRLVKADFLISEKGPGGGFKIVKGKENASLMDIYEVIEGKYIRKDCLFAAGSIQGCHCIMKPMVSTINDCFEDFMTKNKINDFKI